MPLIKLGRVLDAATDSVRSVTEHTLPVIDEAAATMAGTSAQLSKVDTVTTAAAEISQNALCSDGAGRFDRRPPADQARRLLVRRAPGAVRPHGEGPRLMRRLFWIGVGAVGAVVVARQCA